MLAVGEALETQHLPGVVEARLVGGDGTRPRRQVLRPAVLLGQEQVGVGSAGVKGQGAAVWEEKRGDSLNMKGWQRFLGVTVHLRKSVM